ncbi:MAG TPA: MaoC family dehydratase [Gammaproteobacteria bacterium]|nr:MaoC family dehydratase [Gammaproteobacteria bacterium]
MTAIHCYTLEQLQPGMSAQFSRTVTVADIANYAGVSGDMNPLHLDDAFGASTQFGSRIAHGMLSAGYISTILGTKLPGPGAIYVSQTLQFRAPVRIGDTVVATATIKSIDARHARVTLDTICSVGETQVIRGQAVMQIPRSA